MTPEPADTEQSDHAAATRHTAELAATTARRVSEATGWHVEAIQIGLLATRDGYAPLSVHRSTVDEAADTLLGLLTDPEYQPLKLHSEILATSYTSEKSALTGSTESQ
jgi:hypothetical protein